MGRQITPDDFTKYCRQAKLRWRRYEEFRLGHNAEYDSCRKRATVLTWITVILAVATAVFAGFQGVTSKEEKEFLVLGTSIVGALTGAAGVFKQTFNWEKKAQDHLSQLSGARQGLTQVRQWIESLSEGFMSDEQETFLATLDGRYDTMMAKSEIQDFSSWAATADANWEREGLNAIEMHPEEGAAVDDDGPPPQDEGADDGIQMARRGL